MPYLPYDNTDDENKKASQEQSASADGSTNISGQSATVSGATNPGSSAPAGKSGAYANLSEYIDANKDQSSQMGANVANTLTAAGSTVKNDINNTAQDFSQQVDKGTLSNLANANQDVDSTINQAKTLSAGNQVAADQMGRFKDISNASYAGPADVSASQYYGQTNQDLNKADQYKNNAQTDKGRYALLQQVFNSPTYSQGQQNLDNALIVSNDQARNAIGDAGHSLDSLDSNWTKSQADAQAQAADRKVQVDNAKQYAQNTLSGARTSQGQAVDASLADTKSHWTDQYNQYANLLSGYKGGEFDLTADQAKALGLNDGQKIYNSLASTPQNLLDLQAFDPNKVVSKDQVAQLSALDRLANQYGASSNAKYTDPDQAGMLNLNNNFQANRVGASANQAGTDFTNYSKGASFNATGDASRDITAGGWSPFGGNWSTKIGQANGHADGSANLGSFLQGSSPTLKEGGTYDIDPLSLAASSGTSGIAAQLFGGGPQGEANQAAHNLMMQKLQSELSDALAQHGYGNSVKVKRNYL
jgi:hypothetical protein